MIPSGGNKILMKVQTYVVGLTAALITVGAQNNATWTLRSVDISAYIGATARLVIKYTSGTSYTGDTQFDDFNVGGTTYDPESGTNSFETHNTAGAPSDYTTVTWTALTTATAGNGLFLRDTGGTASTGTGNTAGYTGTYYYYAETSGSGAGYPSIYFWLRSPSVTITTSTLSFYSAQNGATCGPFEVYLDIIA